MTDNRTEALEWAEESSDDKTLALTHALLYVGDVLADIHLELASRRDEHAEPGPDPESKLAKLLQKASPFTDKPEAEVGEESNGSAHSLIMPNGRVYKPAHDPRLWKMDQTTGDWISPGGRRFGPKSKQVLGVIRRLEQMRRAGTLYTKPIQYPEPQSV
jgi:hypothetical protein